MNKVIIKRVIKIVIAIYLVVSTLATLNETGKGKEFWEAVASNQGAINFIHSIINKSFR